MPGRAQGELEASLEHRFENPKLLERALTHSSFLQQLKPAGPSRADTAPQEAGDNERLEFLGDAVLGLLATEYLIRRFPDWNEGTLSKSRSRLVNEGSLQEVARRLSLGDYLRLGRGEEKTGGREKPALLADAVEAVVGALYLDGGLGPARRFLGRWLFDPAIQQGTGWLGQTDYKSALQELLQARGNAPAKYRILRESGPDHRKVFCVEVSVNAQTITSAEGTSKKEAEQSAARLALQELSGSDPAG
ncbi:MAG TPA: ribonuclease III [Candidatus Limnocylindria bacterium]|nr:ribonuclease III [Candidatus Limnocylindria bacterium]